MPFLPGITRLVCLLLLALVFIPVSANAAPARQIAPGEPEIGSINAIALDNSGSGWAWAYPKPQTFATSYLLRLENGVWRVAADSSSNPTLMAPGVEIYRMVVTADGTDGWAIGDDPDNDNERPVFWRLDNGAWRLARHNLPDTMRLIGLTLSADGKSGWIVGLDIVSGGYSLLQLSGGSWNIVANPDNGVLEDVAISPDGASTWAIGYDHGQFIPSAYRYVNKKWQVQGALPVADDILPYRLMADNSGSAWLLSSSNDTDPTPASGNNLTVNGQLIRLKPNAAPQVVTPVVTAPASESGVRLNLHDLRVDGLGRGWVSGEFFLGSSEQPGSIAETYRTVFIRINGDAATQIDPASAGLSTDKNFAPIELGMSPDGGHVWSGGRDGIGFGHLNQLHEPWAHSTPAATTPLIGASLCFAAVTNCLRGVFASYWQQHGGLELFGYPITPELQEQISDKTYTVQYTERARFEWHPEFAGTGNEVLLGLLGNQLVNLRLSESPFQSKDPLGCSGCVFFQETNHNIAAPFTAYWQNNGGLSVFGLPQSEAFDEPNAADGKTYKVQYFERNRIEYHPENKGASHEFLLGLLGVEQFKSTYGFTP